MNLDHIKRITEALAGASRQEIKKHLDAGREVPIAVDLKIVYLKPENRCAFCLVPCMNKWCDYTPK